MVTSNLMMKRCSVDRWFRWSALLAAVSIALVASNLNARADRSPPVITGPYAYLLAASTDLGASAERVTITAELRNDSEPSALSQWANARDLAVDWSPGRAWATIEGAAASIASALRVSIHDYRSRRGQVFYAATRQPDVPAALGGEVKGLGRILGYTPHREARPPLPLDVPDGGLVPEAVRATYNVTPLTAAGFTGGGETIVIFAFGGFSQSDLDAFTDMYRLPKLKPEILGDPLSAPSGETTMDLEVAHALAPEARKVVVNARPTAEGDRTYLKVADLMARTDRQFPGAVWALSIGWGCDRLVTAADLAPVRSVLVDAHAHGTAVLDASGDLAGLDCKDGEDWSIPPGPDQIGLDSVASIPEVTSVGGTSLSTDREGRWLTESAWFNSVLTLGSGGGASALFDRPPWQRDVMAERDRNRRLTPDVAAVADMFTGMRIILDGRMVNGGGTSMAAPLWAGMSAVMNQYLRANGGRRLGDLNSSLYRIAQGARHPAIHDVLRGANAVAVAGPGYDLVSGLGSPDVENLVRDLLDLQKALE